MIDWGLLRYYRVLKILSRITKISKYVYCLSIIILLAVYTLYHLLITNTINVMFFIIVMLHTLVWLATPFILKILVDYIKLRQCVSMSLFLLLPGLPLEIGGIFVNMPGLLYIIAPVLGMLSVRAFTNSRIRSLTVGLYIFIIELLFTFLAGLTNPFVVMYRFVLALIPIITSAYFIENLVHKNMPLNVYKIASSWIKMMLLDEEKDFSYILSSIGLETKVDTHMIIFELDSGGIALIIPEIHFGPFKNVGSTLLPYIIDKKLADIGITTLVLHGAGSHERDLADFGESLRYAEDVANAIILRKDLVEDVVFKPFRAYDNQFEAFVLRTSKTPIIIISTPTTGNDDIPYQVQLKASELGNMYGFNDVVIVDAHNVEGRQINDPDKYINIVMTALSRNVEPCREFGVGYGEAITDGHVGGLCSNKVKTLSIKCNDSLYGLVYLYGNNAKIGVRETLRRIALDMGYNDVEVITADDHSCAGISYDFPYQAVECNLHLLKAVKQALIVSRNNIKICKVYISKISTAAKVVGTKIFELLELARTTSQKILKYALSSFLLMYILSASLYLLVLIG